MAAFLIRRERSSHPSWLLQRIYDRLARHKRKIALSTINSLPGKNCLVVAIRRCIIAKLARAQSQNLKARAETETRHRARPQDLAEKLSRPTTGASRAQ